MSYWDLITDRRINRRRALALSGSAALGAAFLAACGGSDDSGGGGQTSSLVTNPEDTTKQAKRGGVYKSNLTADVGSWDAHTRGTWFGTLGALLWNRLTVVSVANGEATSGDIVGDLAEGWELSGDGLTVTWKLRPNNKFNNVAPVNGHAVEAQDVVATWNRWRNVSATRATIDNQVNPDAPVVSMSAPDNRTVVMKLSFPSVTVPSLFSGSVGQAFHITPREVGESYDPRRVQIGSGPFQLKEHVSSAYIHIERNPGYYDAQRPYFDGIEYPVISEYATGLAAFKSGQLHTFAVRPEEVLTVKREVPDLLMYQSDFALPSASLFFGYKATPGGMFRDKRLRQAYSMSIDRDLFAEVWYNVSKFTSEGLPVETAWSSAVPINEFRGWWLDPQSKDFGPNAKYYQHNVAEAKKLVAAAGFANGVEYRATRAGDNYGPEYDRQIDVMDGMAAEAGFKPTTNSVNYQTDLVPNYQSSRGEFEGTGWMLRPQSSSDPIDKFAEYMFSGSGPNFIGFDAAGKGDHSGDPYVDDLIRKSQIERDGQKRKNMLLDLQRHFGDAMYIIRPVSGSTGFDLAWPALMNFLQFRGARRSEELSYFWMDTTKKPFNT
jgi:peptide/nickel transport system substrate-binding protein